MPRRESNGLPQAVPAQLALTTPRRAAALALRARYQNYTRIGEILGITKQSAHELVLGAVRDMREGMTEDAEIIRELECKRLDDMGRRLLARMNDPKNENPERTVDSLLRIMERRAALLGLDAPKDWRLGGIPGGEPITVADGETDLSVLSVGELQQLEEILERGKRIAIVDAPKQLSSTHEDIMDTEPLLRCNHCQHGADDPKAEGIPCACGQGIFVAESPVSGAPVESH